MRHQTLRTPRPQLEPGSRWSMLNYDLEIFK
ncbi:CG31704 [Drosophila busckii]|uniref:CG31704 n=1 Tax=Drosophila busckii TaxID=30019 RepID=A0A0M4E5G3_DROBS|nr:CG31704 [Drosophila busckii]